MYPILSRILSAAVLAACMAGHASATSTGTPECLLDAQKAEAVFEGIGALSAGASSRLLVDYPEPQRGEILDYLFKPKFGASLQHLKVEIGGDADSTDGTEPSIAYTREEFTNPKPTYFNRGYEWWLMKEAKKRNPGIIFDILQWGAPGWVGNHKFYSQDNADLIVAFIKGAKKYHDLDVSYCGVWNERMYDVAWIKLLRKTLDQNGLNRVRIVAADEINKWTIADKMTADPALRDAVQVVGTHYPKFNSTPAALGLGKPVWANEDGPWNGTWSGAQTLARMYNRNYAVGKMTKTIIWSPITSYYDILPLPGSGLMRANQPWSGHYEVQPAAWITAHTTQFIQPGWKYLDGGACTLLPAGGSQVAAVSPDGREFSLVVETVNAKVPEALSFRLAGGLKAAALQAWKSTAKEQFFRQEDITVTDGAFKFTAEPGAVYSITNTTGQTKGITSSIPASAPMPLPYAENFDRYGTGRTPNYLSDFYGVFETATAPDGRACLEQKTLQPPIAWVNQGEEFTFTLAGDAGWRDYMVSCDIRMDFRQDARLFGRIQKVLHGKPAACRGYCLTIRPDGAWELGAPDKQLLAGKAQVTPNAWHNFGLRFLKDTITVMVDGKEAGSVTDGTYKHGLIGLGGQREPVRFSRLRVDGKFSARHAVTVQHAASSSDWDAEFTADKVLVPGQRWNADDGKSVGEWLELDFGAPKMISGVGVVQFDTRIIDCTLQAWRNGKWTEIAAAKPTDDEFEFSFAPVETAKIRLRVNATKDGQTPSIHEMRAWE